MVRAAGGEIHSTAPVDLGDVSQVEAWIEDAATRFGGIDILYNNAADFVFGLISEMSDEDWHFTLRNELDVVFYACRAAWPHLKRSPHAVIINVASITGMVAFRPGIGTGAQPATKGGVIGLTRELANEGAPDGIRVNTLSPATSGLNRGASCGIRCEISSSQSRCSSESACRRTSQAWRRSLRQTTRRS